MSSIIWWGSNNQNPEGDEQSSQREPATLQTQQSQQPPQTPKKTKILELIQKLKQMHQKIREKERTTNRTKADVDLLNDLNAELEKFIQQNFTT